jgi:hypothetical protein
MSRCTRRSVETPQGRSETGIRHETARGLNGDLLMRGRIETNDSAFLCCFQST